MRDLFIGVVLVGGLFIALLLLRVLKWTVYRAFRAAILPLESRFLVLLQDRATARALGVDVGIVRARRKIDFPDH